MKKIIIPMLALLLSSCEKMEFPEPDQQRQSSDEIRIIEYDSVETDVPVDKDPRCKKGCHIDVEPSSAMAPSIDQQASINFLLQQC